MPIPPRTDKWYLGSGHPLMWAPPFPVWLHLPGLWDEATYYNYRLDPVYAISLVDEEGNEIPLTLQDRAWQPSGMTRTYQAAHPNLSISEQSACLPGNILLSRFTMNNQSGSAAAVSLVVWTTRDAVSVRSVKGNEKGIDCGITLKNKGRPDLDLQCRLILEGGVDSFSVQASEETSAQPRWSLTPFYDAWDGQLNNQARISLPSQDGRIFMGLHRKFSLGRGKSRTVTTGVRVNLPDDPGKKGRSGRTFPRLTPAQSDRHWESYFSSLPYLDTSDEFINRYYWYRWYGLKLMTLPGGEGNYPHPAVCEGIGYFRAPISYSAQCHMRETRWMPNPDLARGCLLNFIHQQRENGEFPGYLDLKGQRQEMFYHADWGTPVLDVHRIHPDLEFLQKAYDALTRYTRGFDQDRDPDGSGLYAIHNHYETGQEFMSRYTAVSSQADEVNWGHQFTLKGVDATVYLYQIKKALHEMAIELNRPDEEKDVWQRGYETIRAAVIANMWDPEEQMFSDVDPETARRTGVKAAVCFYPYLTDIVGMEHLGGLRRHLLNPGEFWTPFPVPATSLTDPSFSAEAVWKNRRMNCPWNGRVWPMVNSHLAECLARVAIRLDKDFRPITAEFIRKFIRMMFFDRDSMRPNSFEHYHPFTGRPSLYRGIDDYQHSWVVDLILKYAAGVRPGIASVTVDPFPFGLKKLHLKNLIIRGHHLEIRLENESFSVNVDHGPARESTLGKPLELAI